MSRTHKRLPDQAITATIESLTHEGKGVSHIDDKVVFIDGALPGEEVMFRYTKRQRRYDEGRVDQVLRASADRVEPKCSHYGLCGGCSLMHMDPAAQIKAKQQMLLDDLRHLGKVEPEQILEPLTGPRWGYRRKARLGVKYVAKKGKVLVGFREKGAPYLADLSRCEVLHPEVGYRLEALSDVIGQLQAKDQIAQIEVAISDELTALVFRNLVALSDGDQDKLRSYASANHIHLYLQPKGPDSIFLLWPEHSRLVYALPEYDLHLEFRPTDFTQVNMDINRRMIPRALQLLEPQPEDVVLDLFCGLGNFSLPLARQVSKVIGVEGEAGLVQRAQDNATRNAITNAEFHVANLAGDVSVYPWLRQHYDKILLDPPRTGALEVLPQLARFAPERMVYVSCNPATLARDAGELAHKYGYRLASAGVMDMFPHTAHVESIALFIRK
ncbi:MAG: 23S rRNA (uracil(1939)-C(5))-methyltransferase [Gammaproteobacteria bacterium RBG_16_57_12]|nr:MAG: 23S rRNA (uracil(1939)-C(5))-methyltransferase [Gammaproteobacteria bacterium RBG_16_57_12]